MWEESFSNRLRIRPTSQHSKCATCMKHKAIMRKLSNHQEALAMQSRLWGRHMERQFADRQCYWHHRSMSRVGHDIHGLPTLCIIIDGMDRGKWAVPRSGILASKAFNGLNRPSLDCTALIAHGHCVCTAFGHPNVIKGANWTCDLITFLLDRLTAAGTDLRAHSLTLQADNCSKESKNNTTARLLATLVGKGLLRSARLQYCMSGHSHEDIDQYFSLLSTFLQTQCELHEPMEFQQALRRYLSNPSVRPLERLREVVQVDQVRDWSLYLFCRGSVLCSQHFIYIYIVCGCLWYIETKKHELNLSWNLRTSHLKASCHGNFLNGMGGPGAPHCFSFERYADIKGLLITAVVFKRSFTGLA